MKTHIFLKLSLFLKDSSISIHLVIYMMKKARKIASQLTDKLKIDSFLLFYLFTAPAKSIGLNSYYSTF